MTYTLVPTSVNTSPASNADAAELAHFGDLAADWWNEHGAFRTLHAINPLRLDWIRGHALLAGRRVVDVGCGGGILAESMARQGAEVLGIDLAEPSLQVASSHAAQEKVANLNYRCISAEDLAREEPASYNVVTCMEMLEHVPDPQAVVRACAALVKPGGWVFFSTIARNPKAFAMAIVGAEYALRLLPRGTHTYDKFIKPSELVRYARQVGLHTVAMQGLHYNPLTKHYSLGAGMDVNYLVACQKPCPI